MNALFFLIDRVLELYTFLIFLWVIMGWLISFGVIPAYNQFVGSIMGFLHRVIDPALQPIRRIIPPVGGLDLSPLVLIFLVWFIRVLLVRDIAPLFGVGV